MSALEQRSGTQGRVALVCAGLGVVNRGYERLAQDMYDLLAPEFDVTLVRGGGPRRAGEIRLRVPRRNEQPLARLGFDRALAIELATFASRLLPQLARGKFDVVHYLEPYLGNVLHAARRRLRLSFTLMMTDGVGMTAASSRRADYLHVVTKRAEDQVRAGGRSDETLYSIPCGIRVERFRPTVAKDEARRLLGLPAEPRIVLDVAALNRHHKRIDYLIEEVARLDDGTVLVVDGSLEDPTLLALAQRLLGDRFRYLHVATAEVPLLYTAADVFVHGALEEGFGLAIVEAMAAALPVVVHDESHYRWLVGDERQLIDLAAPGALATALAALPPDAPERNQARAAELDWAALRPQYAAMYDDVLTAARPRHSHIVPPR